MTQKFWCTVADRIGNYIDSAATHDGMNRTSKAGQLLDAAVRSRIQSGEYPEHWGEPEGVHKQTELGIAALSILRAIAGGAMPDPSAVEKAARELGVSPRSLAANLEGYGRQARGCNELKV